MTALANVGARVLEEGYAIRASDIDVVYVERFRISPSSWRARCSTPTPLDCRPVLGRVNEYRRQFGDYWQPSPLLERLANQGLGFYTDAA